MVIINSGRYSCQSAVLDKKAGQNTESVRETDEDGEEDRDTEDVILEFTEEDAGADKDADFPEWEKIDAYIESEIGFVPDYEIN